VTDKETRATILKELAEEWNNEYERLTLLHGSYGQLKVRAAYRLASQLALRKAEAD